MYTWSRGFVPSDSPPCEAVKVSTRDAILRAIWRGYWVDAEHYPLLTTEISSMYVGVRGESYKIDSWLY